MSCSAWTLDNEQVLGLGDLVLALHYIQNGLAVIFLYHTLHLLVNVDQQAVSLLDGLRVHSCGDWGRCGLAPTRH